MTHHERRSLADAAAIKSLENYAAICGQLIVVHRFPDVIKQHRFFLSVQFPTMVGAI
jgi:hypothetical protein